MGAPEQDRARRLAALHRDAAWPTSSPHPDLAVVGRPGQGMSMVLERIERRAEPVVILEIGAEFGGSTRKFLSADEHVWVISIDPWPDHYRSPWPQLAPLLGAPGSMLSVFQSFCWPYRDRLIPLRRSSPEGIVEVFRAGIVPDIIYIDGDHRYDAVFTDLSVCHALFPDAWLCGDDWAFVGKSPRYRSIRYPVRRAVQAFCHHHGFGFSAYEQTWMVFPYSPAPMQTLRRRFGDISEEANAKAASDQTAVGAAIVSLGPEA